MNNLPTREKTIRDGILEKRQFIFSMFGDKGKADKFMATANKIANDFKLRDCHPQSIIDACGSVAQIDLDLSPVLSQVYLVPFKAKKEQKIASIQLIISARGYKLLMNRMGWSIKSYIVNEADTFNYQIDGFDEIINFKKNLDDTEQKFKYAVAMAQSPDNKLYAEVMNLAQIEKHRRVSDNQKKHGVEQASGVWLEWFDKMSDKTVVKELIKKLPIGETVAKAVYIDDKPIEVEAQQDKQKIELKIESDLININQQTGEILNNEIEI